MSGTVEDVIAHITSHAAMGNDGACNYFGWVDCRMNLTGTHKEEKVWEILTKQYQRFIAEIETSLYNDSESYWEGYNDKEFSMFVDDCDEVKFHDCVQRKLKPLIGDTKVYTTLGRTVESLGESVVKQQPNSGTFFLWYRWEERFPEAGGLRVFTITDALKSVLAGEEI